MATLHELNKRSDLERAREAKALSESELMVGLSTYGNALHIPHISNMVGHVVIHSGVNEIVLRESLI